jgi:hypothetical protein
VPIPPYLIPTLLPNQTVRFYLRREFSSACQGLVCKLWGRGGILRMPFYLCTGVPMRRLRAQAPYRFCKQPNGDYAYRKDCMSEWQYASEEVKPYLLDPNSYYEDIYFDEHRVTLSIPFDSEGKYISPQAPPPEPDYESEDEDDSEDLAPQVYPTQDHSSLPVPPIAHGIASASGLNTDSNPENVLMSQPESMEALISLLAQYGAGSVPTAVSAEQSSIPRTSNKRPRIIDPAEEAEMEEQRMRTKTQATTQASIAANHVRSEEKPIENPLASIERNIPNSKVLDEQNAADANNIAALYKRPEAAPGVELVPNHQSCATTSFQDYLDYTNMGSTAVAQPVSNSQYGNMATSLTAVEAGNLENGIRSVEHAMMSFFDFDAFDHAQKPAVVGLRSNNEDDEASVPSLEDSCASSTTSSTPGPDTPSLEHDEFPLRVHHKRLNSNHIGLSGGSSSSNGF